MSRDSGDHCNKEEKLVEHQVLANIVKQTTEALARQSHISEMFIGDDGILNFQCLNFCLKSVVVSDR